MLKTLMRSTNSGLNLWGNKCDLSITSGTAINLAFSPMELITRFDQNILCNHTDHIWNSISDEDNHLQVIEIISDNAGFEQCTDFCLADFLITHNLAKKVIFNFKAFPWFVSDTTIADQRRIIRYLINSDKPMLKKFGIRWNKYIREKVWIMDDDTFWTSPLDYTFMEEKAPALYERLKEAKLAIFKGDLNYRKLFADKNWEPTTPISVAKQNFNPTLWCVIRTVKADIICGLPKGLAENLDTNDPEWMITGNYGVIQFSEIDQQEVVPSVYTLPA